jgi:hypothetical protein
VSGKSSATTCDVPNRNIYIINHRYYLDISQKKKISWTLDSMRKILYLYWYGSNVHFPLLGGKYLVEHRLDYKWFPRHLLYLYIVLYNP